MQRMPSFTFLQQSRNKTTANVKKQPKKFLTTTTVADIDIDNSIIVTAAKDFTSTSANSIDETNRLRIINKNKFSAMDIQACHDLLTRGSTVNLLRRAPMMGFGGTRASTGSKKAQRRCNDLMIGGNSDRITIVWSIDQAGMPPVSWVEHAILTCLLITVLLYCAFRFIQQWNQWLCPPLTDKSKNYTPLTMLKPSRISMVRIVASEDQGVLVTKPTRKMLEVARLRDMRSQQLRAHYSEPIRLNVDSSSIAAALLGASASRGSSGGGPVSGGSPSHAKTIAYSLAKFATAPSHETPDNRSSPPPTLNVPGCTGPAPGFYSPPNEMVSPASSTLADKKTLSASYSTGLVMLAGDEQWSLQQNASSVPLRYLANVIPSVIVDAASPPPTKLQHMASFPSQPPTPEKTSPDSNQPSITTTTRTSCGGGGGGGDCGTWPAKPKTKPSPLSLNY